MLFVKQTPMRITVLSQDIQITDSVRALEIDPAPHVEVVNPNSDQLEILTELCTNRPNLLIADDDFLKPNTVKLMKSIRKVVKNVDMIFVTSDASLELGREVSRLGIQSYMLKPIEANVLSESLEHLTKHHKQL